MEKPILNTIWNINYNWVAGFFSGDGCFFIDIFKSKTSKLNYAIKLRAIIGQHYRDESSLLRVF